MPSRHTLTTLSLKDLDLRAETNILGSLLATLPFITVRHLSNLCRYNSDTNHDGLDDALLLQFLDFTLVPLLAELSVETRYTTPYNTDTFLDFLHSRSTRFQPKHGTSLLKSITLSLPRADPLLLEIKDAFQQHGTDLTITELGELGTSRWC